MKTETMVELLQKMFSEQSIRIVEEDGSERIVEGNVEGNVTLRVGEAAVKHLNTPEAKFYFCTEDSLLMTDYLNWEWFNKSLKEHGCFYEIYNPVEFLIYEI